ncbi:hypothetical protein SAMN05421823_10783 [Catalinimonas alkaloidigena]|uniref:Uncharacterized protein n=1 Tax=Catalinimonas alkaloidigena TaxID=1075417 RepID=A0A1G9LKW7_9BACT|nr:hypothetical protein [Catalinimonas alkaloidigena]SDL62601.1 hypothetical protein SAMN05421823_10783 [Catalinimonas alkaloidigena]
MLELTEIGNHYFKLIEEEITVSEFEEWVYKLDPVTSGLTNDEHLTLLSINYSSKSVKYEVRDALKRFINYRKYTTITLLKSLTTILNKKGGLDKPYELSNNEFGQLLYVSKQLDQKFTLTFNTSFVTLLQCYPKDMDSSERLIIYNSKLPSSKKLVSSLCKWICSEEVRLIVSKELTGTTWWDYGKEVDERDTEIKITIRTDKRWYDLRIDELKVLSIIEK